MNQSNTAVLGYTFHRERERAGRGVVGVVGGVVGGVVSWVMDGVVGEENEKYEPVTNSSTQKHGRFTKVSSHLLVM